MGLSSSKSSSSTASPSQSYSGSSGSKQSSSFTDILSTLSFEQKLAPKAASGDESHPECPICFLNFESLNQMTCCKADVCTNCYLEIRLKNPKNTSCPFCSQVSFSVIYRGSGNQQSTSTPTSSTPSSPALGTSPSSSSSSSSSAAADIGAGITGKPRSGSVGSPTVITASVSDRQDLEREIRKMRGDSPSSTFVSPQRSASARSSVPRARGAAATATLPTQPVVFNAPTFSASAARRQTHSGIAASRIRQVDEDQVGSAPTATAHIMGSRRFAAPVPPPTTAATQRSIVDDNTELASQLALLQYFISSPAAEGFGNATELEDLLMMEAIKLSLQESQSSSSSSTEPPESAPAVVDIVESSAAVDASNHHEDNQSVPFPSSSSSSSAAFTSAAPSSSSSSAIGSSSAVAMEVDNEVIVESSVPKSTEKVDYDEEQLMLALSLSLQPDKDANSHSNANAYANENGAVDSSSSIIDNRVSINSSSFSYDYSPQSSEQSLLAAISAVSLDGGKQAHVQQVDNSNNETSSANNQHDNYDNNSSISPEELATTTASLLDKISEALASSSSQDNNGNSSSASTYQDGIH